MKQRGKSMNTVKKIIFKLRDMFNSDCHKDITQEYTVFITKPDLRKEYYDVISGYVIRIYYALIELEESNIEKYVGCVSALKDELPANYADLVPYEKITQSCINNIIEELANTESEVYRIISQYRAEKEHEYDIETGKQSLDALGINSLKNLDEFLWEKRNKDDKEKTETIRTLSNAIATMKGKTSLGAFAAARKNDNDDSGN